VVTPRRIWIAAGVVGVLVTAAVVVLVLAVGNGDRTARPRQAISGKTYLSRSAALFADPLRVRIELLVDRNRVDPARVGFNPTFILYSRVGVPRLQRYDTGPVTHLVYTADLVCLTYACLPSYSGTRVQFSPAKVFYWPRDGGPQRTLELPWFPFALGARTSEADLNNADPFRQPAWRATTEPEAVSYGISPSLLRALLFIGSGLLFLCALGAFVAFAQAVRRWWRPPVASPLERAVALVEQASVRDDQPAKRKALELLSRELTHTGEGELALAARELAWAEPAPVPAATQPLTLDVRRLIVERSNGHAR
jgi:hypothetical protein